MTLSQSSSPNSRAGALRMMPALLTRMSRRPSELTHSLYYIGGEPRVGFEKVHFHGVELAALVPDEVSGLVHRFDVERGHVCAGFGEARGDALPEAAGRTRYQGDLAVEAEVVEDAH